MATETLTRHRAGRIVSAFTTHLLPGPLALQVPIASSSDRDSGGESAQTLNSCETKLKGNPIYGFPSQILRSLPTGLW